jgi:hypothetical protein
MLEGWPLLKLLPLESLMSMTFRLSRCAVPAAPDAPSAARG